MVLDAGARLGPYEIVAPIGKGGMGEVYRARDAKLERDVAIKVLPDELASDEERVARFEREAKLLASLNHPNIASIYGFESGALVLELVEGLTLAERIEQGPIPVDEALAIARQIAEALEAGHEAGIIHRDLKPANIKLKDDGTVKVLDYGLAKALEDDAAPSGDAALSQSPTLTRQGTQVGVILGTAAYMSPEQAKGKRVDKRADVWAFGIVLFEMLTGRQAFGASDVSQTLALVLTRELDWSALPDETPPAIRRLLRRSVAREPNNRLGDMSVARLEIDDAGDASATEMTTTPVLARPALWQRPLPAVAALVLALVVGGLGGWGLTRPDPPQIVRVPIPLGEGESFPRFGGSAVAISPDGRNIVYSANDALFLRPVDQLETTTLLEPGWTVTHPFFSPGGNWVGYMRQGQLRKVSVSGGAPVTLAESGLLFGASWTEDDVILFGQGSNGIWQVPGVGGAPEQVIAVEDGESVHGPQMLPGGEWVLFTLRLERTDGWDDAQIVVQSVKTGERHVLIERGRDGRYLPTGHLTYALNAVLFAVPFDVSARAVTGGAVPLVQSVRPSFGASSTGALYLSVAENGSLIYVPGSDLAGDQVELLWVDRTGQANPVGVEPRRYQWARVSPDGNRVALHVLGVDNADVWIYDLGRATLTRLTFDEAFDGFPLWSPDGSRVVFQSSRDGGGLFWKSSDGTGEVELLLESPNAPRPSGWSADGRLVFNERGGIGVVNGESNDAWELLIEGGTEASMSPDGRWIAYSFLDPRAPTEGIQIYVRPFPNVDEGRWQMSTEHGFDPLWSPDGRELFFNTRSGLMVVRVETQPAFSHGPPEPLPVDPGTSVVGTEFDITPDGERFLILSTSTEHADGLVFVEHWFEELKRLVPIE